MWFGADNKNERIFWVRDVRLLWHTRPNRER